MAVCSQIKKILVPTDGSDQSLCAARYAAEIARCMDAEVVLLNVMQVTGLSQFVAYSIDATENLSGELRTTGEEIIERTKAPFRELDVPVHSKIIEGYPAEAILHESEEGKYDLIVIGSRGTSAGLIRRIVFGLGNVADRVASNAICPVLIVRQ